MAGTMTVLSWLKDFVEKVMPALNEIIIFFFIVFISFLIGKIVGRLVRKLLGDFKSDAWFRKLLGTSIPAAKLISGFTAGAIYTIGVIIALRAVGLGPAVITLLVVILFVSVVLGLLVALRDLIPNAVAGLTLRSRRDIRVGARLKMSEVEGLITEVTLLETHVKTREGEMVIIPNALFTRSAFRVKVKK
ncbi:hypothetical protein D6789_02905 [Candidatus Woesearchaeota archaeon]|nr:MAG: hypothetical protein D6789_02905 [Candidatus Woesearchaeota archaeon]